MTLSAYFAVIPRACGGSSTPRLFGSTTDASGILDHPLSRVMTTGNLAVRNYENTLLRSRHAIAPELCTNTVPPEHRGRREGRVQAAPMARQQIKKLAADTTGLAEHPAFPARRCYGLWRALPGDRAFLPPSSAALVTPANLASASGGQDHTLLPSATAAFVRGGHSVHRSPPHVS